MNNPKLPITIKYVAKYKNIHIQFILYVLNKQKQIYIQCRPTTITARKFHLSKEDIVIGLAGMSIMLI
jgi:hypothetical protein